MKIIEKMAQKASDNMDRSGVTIAFLGDSVTQGCFEICEIRPGAIEAIYDKNAAYHNYLARIFTVLYPTVPVNIINAGISGDNAVHGLSRLERDVISHSPDLTVVCFGLNDCGRGEQGITEDKDALAEMFKRLTAAGGEVIFMTPNMMCTGVSHLLTNDLFRGVAAGIAGLQNAGMLDKYVAAAVDAANIAGVRVCDCYSKWKRLNECGVDTTELLANKINHPDRNMNWLFAIALTETMFE